jgi:hypothetical protein
MRRVLPGLLAAATILGARHAAAFEPEVPLPPEPSSLDDYGTKLVDSGEAFPFGISVGGTAWWIPFGSVFGARVTLRTGTHHEILFEAAKLTFCANTYTATFAGYHYVGRAESILRPYAGVDVGYAHLQTMIPCQSIANWTPASTYAGLGALGLRLEPIPALSFFVEARGGVMSLNPYYFAGAGGGLQVNLPF